VHDRWLRSQRFELPGTRAAFGEAFDTVVSVTARRDRLDEQVAVTAGTPAWAPIVSRLCAVRGVATLTGLGLAVEIGDWDRFTGSSIGAYLGLVPTESSSGASRSQGSITKTGNTHARRLLVEAAWHHQRPLRTPSKTLTTRRAGLSPAVRARGQAADARLHRRSTAPALDHPAGAQEAAHHHRGRRCPGTGRLVLEPGHHGRLINPRPQPHPDAAALHRPAGGRTRARQREERPASAL